MTIDHGCACGGKKTGAYTAWMAMRTRCNNPNSAQYPRYGGRGIQVCARWNSFNNFLADMGERPDGMSLDRIDVNGDYEPSNCRWATRDQQNNNARSNHRVTIDGKTQTAAQWAREMGINPQTIYRRINAGATALEALLMGKPKWMT